MKFFTVSIHAGTKRFEPNSALRNRAKSESVKELLQRPNMDKKQIEALAKKNAAKAAGGSSAPKRFGKKYDPNLADDPTDEATIKKLAESERFFAEMKKRDF